MHDVVDTILHHVEQCNAPLCCHVGSHDVFAVGESLVRGLRQRGQIATFASMHTPRSRWFHRFFPQTSADWFARAAGCSHNEAADRIATLPLPVHPDMNCNAGNPRCLLAVAAAAYRSPDLVVYSSSGMDPAGIQTLQAAIHDLCVGTRAIHIRHSRSSRRDDRRCSAQRPMLCIACDIPSATRPAGG